jgi:hypothetical protein
VEGSQRVVFGSKGDHRDEHPFTLTSLNNLAWIYGFQGWWKDAEAQLLQVMEISKRVLGHDHPETLASIANYAYLKLFCW